MGKIRLNEDSEVVKTVRRELAEKGGYIKKNNSICIYGKTGDYYGSRQ